MTSFVFEGSAALGWKETWRESDSPGRMDPNPSQGETDHPGERPTQPKDWMRQDGLWRERVSDFAEERETRPKSREEGERVRVGDVRAAER